MPFWMWIGMGCFAAWFAFLLGAFIWLGVHDTEDWGIDYD